MLVSSGGVLGCALALAGITMLRTTLPAQTPRFSEVALDARALAFWVLITLLVGLLSAGAPFLLASARETSRLLRASRTASSATSRTRAALIVSEVALAVVLMCGAALRQ